MRKGVALCKRVPIKKIFAKPLAEIAGCALLDPFEVEDPEDISFALCFLPEDDAFAPYTRIKAAVSIGAGAEGIVACSSLPDVPVVRIIDADQANQMAAFALWHIVYWHRRFPDILAAQEEARWRRPIANRSPSAKTVGVLGRGVMGGRIAAVAADLGYPTRTYSRSPQADAHPAAPHYCGTALGAFLDGLDILVAALPGTDQTRGMIDGALLSQLNEGAVLIQLGRGGQVVEADLMAALDGGHLSGASLDVFEEEPLPSNHPLWRHPKVLVTPHSASEASAEAVAHTVVRTLQAIEDGRTPSGTVDRKPSD
ncbi:MAG: NAD(P)-dependent oxidoreductase [Pseudomonadota bacterium]